MILHTCSIEVPIRYLLYRGLDPDNCIFFDIETTGFRAEYTHLYLIGAACRPETAYKAGWILQADISAVNLTLNLNEGSVKHASTAAYDREAARTVPSAKVESTSKTTTVADPEDSSETETWVLIQWLAERPQEETTLLRSFSQFRTAASCVAHFNGDRFDIPYLEEKYRQYQLPSPFKDTMSVDLYQDFRPLKSFLGLDRMNQKSLEAFLGRTREDRYDGGLLIPVYHDFCKTGDSQLKKLLLLHNLEDVSGMLGLIALYAYHTLLSDFLDKQIYGKKFSDEAMAYETRFDELLSDGTRSDGISSNTDLVIKTSTSTDCFYLSFPLLLPVPVPIHRSWNLRNAMATSKKQQTDTTARAMPVVLSLKDQTGQLRLPLCNDSLCYFFKDYKNYYYLPEEDQAIHKSVAAYVDRQHRRPACADNCYIRQSGVFLPQTEELFTPALRYNRKDTITWFSLQEHVPMDEDAWKKYISSWLRKIITS